MAETTAKQVPNPGSIEAVALGCLCPVIDNGRGRGAYTDVDGTPLFWYTDGCPLHLPLHLPVRPAEPDPFDVSHWPHDGDPARVLGQGAV